MQLGYVTHPGRGETDRFLARFAVEQIEQGRRIAGVVQNNIDCDDGTCDMDLRVLPAGPLIRISQSLGAHSKGCRLNAGELERAVSLVEPSLRAGVDLLIINKFGKHECEGRGFRPLIAEAMSKGLPVLLGVNTANIPAFLEFAGELADTLPADSTRICQWLDRA